MRVLHQILSFFVESDKNVYIQESLCHGTKINAPKQQVTYKDLKKTVIAILRKNNIQVDETKDSIWIKAEKVSDETGKKETEKK